MQPEDRRKFNQKIKALQYRLGIDDDIFRDIVLNVEPRSEGHLTHCDDESANLILISLRRVSDRQGTGGSQTAPRPAPSRQNRQVARLMDYLNWTWKQTAHLCFRMTGKTRTDKCSPRELSLVIRAMVHIIDNDLKSGKITLPDAQLADYITHTNKFRKALPSQKLALSESERSEDESNGSGAEKC